ncbi:MAG: RNA pseudouridine synthase [Desulfatiglandaceae bacterium]|jgi:23S rRNA pseudouridine1911/1915/1917 synthase
MSRIEDRIKILYEDNHLLGLYKPAGMLTQGDRTGDLSLLDWAKAWLKKRYMKPGKAFLGLVHRLDRPVAGAVLFARTSKAASRLSAQIREHKIRKTYWAIVQGRPRPPEGKSKAFLTRRGSKSIITTQHDPSGRAAELTYRVLESRGPFSLVEIALITGRHHQIRCQFAALGCPILGDLKYGFSHALPSRNIGLLARSLICRHPTRPVDVTLESPIPDDWPWPPG